MCQKGAVNSNLMVRIDFRMLYVILKMGQNHVEEVTKKYFYQRGSTTCRLIVVPDPFNHDTMTP